MSVAVLDPPPPIMNCSLIPRLLPGEEPGYKANELHTEVILLVELACPLVQVLMGSGDGVVKLFDSSTSKYHWEVNSDPKYPKYITDSFVPGLTPLLAFFAVWLLM